MAEIRLLFSKRKPISMCYFKFDNFFEVQGQERREFVIKPSTCLTILRNRLHGKTNIEMARIEFICDCFYDIFNDYMKMYHEKDGRLLASMGTDCRIRSSDLTGITSEMRQAYMETCRRILPFLEKTLKMCNNGGQYFMGSQITMADLMCYSALENPLLENPTLLQEYPKLQALRTRVAEHAQLSIYFNRRHKTDF
ncbi:Hypothetical predicted protein [Octopus vulgaris]|uniref:GST C-terminal domain-containing protein n=1 Tax=Octopus vulgaris TaxID=6645 RepID=A0AA36AVN6_OCTVU|nr:Hypothetical predicted protein [Octopus vulgaris]